MNKFCTNCGQEISIDDKFCVNCGKEINRSNSEVNDNVRTVSAFTPKSKIVAGLLGIFLGSFGIHNFYLGFNGKGVTQLLMTLLSCGILSFVSAIWSFIEGIMILAGSISLDAQGNPLGE